MSNSVGSPPQARTSAATAMPEEETIWLRPTGSPGITSSSPVERMATRGLRRTDSHGRFIAAEQRHVARGQHPAGRERRIARGEVEAGLADVAAGRGASRMVILPCRRALVSSWMTIESAPIGSGPPVKMRTASPGFSA